MLGSVVALANTNGQVVERYAYDPYGQTMILGSDWHPLRQINYYDPTATRFFHDADEDGDIDSADAAHLSACLGLSSLECVFYHDRTFDGVVDIVDQGIFVGFYPPGGTAPPEFGRPAFGRHDANGDGHVDLADHGRFQLCFGSTSALCLEIFDADTNGTVELADYTASNGFAAAYTGAGDLPLAAVRASRYSNPWMWTGQRRDATTDTYHFWARTFAPAGGRWLRRDPAGYLGETSLYGYVSSGPLRWIDVLGLEKVIIVVGQDVGIGGKADAANREKANEEAGHEVAVTEGKSKQEILDAVGDDSVDGVVIVAHGDKGGEKLGGFKGGAAVIAVDPDNLYSEGEVTPEDIAKTKKGKKLRKVELVVCYQGHKKNIVKWEEAFGDGVEVTGPSGGYHPGVHLLWPWGYGPTFPPSKVPDKTNDSSSQGAESSGPDAPPQPRGGWLSGEWAGY